MIKKYWIIPATATIGLFLLVACGQAATPQPTNLPAPSTPAPLPTLTSTPVSFPPTYTNVPTPSFAPAPSEETTGIPVQQDQFIPPLPPSQLQAELSTGPAVQLTWQGTGEDIVVYYQIYRRVAGTEDWQPLAQVPSQGDNRGNYQYLDTGAQKGETYEYEVTAIDQYSHESQPSNVASIKIV